MRQKRRKLVGRESHKEKDGCVVEYRFYNFLWPNGEPMKVAVFKARPGAPAQSPHEAPVRIDGLPEELRPTYDEHVKKLPPRRVA